MNNKDSIHEKRSSTNLTQRHMSDTQKEGFFSEEEYYSDFPTLTINVAHLT